MPYLNQRLGKHDCRKDFMADLIGERMFARRGDRTRQVLGPVVQSIVSLTASLRRQLIKYMLTTLSNTLLFFGEKM